METKQSQIKINLPLKLKKKIEKRAEEYDMTIAGYMRHLMVMDIKYGNIPVMEPSEGSKKAFREALKEEKEGKLKEIKNIKEFFDNISK